MSDSEGENGRPDDVTIENALRDIVRDAAQRDEEVTVKRARTRAEERLGLDAGFFKDDPEWKKRSSEVIKATFEEPTSPENLVEVPVTTKAGTKRKSDDRVEKTKKRRKQSPVVESEDENEPTSEPVAAVQDAIQARKAEAKSKPTTEPKSAATSELSSPPDTDLEEAAPSKPNGGASVPPPVEDDDSDLSSPIDNPLPTKKRRKKPTSPTAVKSKAAKPVKAAKATKSDKSLSPDEEEIRRLQSWLLKCGIRKLWHKELESCSTPKEKIKHLKSMLEEAGMKGRFSAEKAREIKEARELKAELEAVEEFNDQWGRESDEDKDEADEKEEVGKGRRRAKVEEDEDDAPQKRGRRKPRGLIDFGDDDDSD